MGNSRRTVTFVPNTFEAPNIFDFDEQMLLRFAPRTSQENRLSWLELFLISLISWLTGCVVFFLWRLRLSYIYAMIGGCLCSSLCAILLIKLRNLGARPSRR